jgi:hypothetical protein
MKVNSIQALIFSAFSVFSAVKGLFPGLDVYAAGMRFTHLFGFATMPEL